MPVTFTGSPGLGTVEQRRSADRSCHTYYFPYGDVASGTNAGAPSTAWIVPLSKFGGLGFKGGFWCMDIEQTGTVVSKLQVYLQVDWGLNSGNILLGDFTITNADNGVPAIQLPTNTALQTTPDTMQAGTVLAPQLITVPFVGSEIPDYWFYIPREANGNVAFSIERSADSGTTDWDGHIVLYFTEVGGY